MAHSPMEEEVAQANPEKMDILTEKLQLNQAKIQTLTTEHRKLITEYHSTKMYDDLKKSLYKQCDVLKAIEKLTKVRERYDEVLQKQNESIAKGNQKVEKYLKHIENIKTGLLRLRPPTDTTAE
ncbi:hypothetical protein TYRP_006680 [Tyrophagus putrescentiae]|nr:hypothetical protein TYRP_006680 [Tyrophagus putrescentiae]